MILSVLFFNENAKTNESKQIPVHGSKFEKNIFLKKELVNELIMLPTISCSGRFTIRLQSDAVFTNQNKKNADGYRIDESSYIQVAQLNTKQIKVIMIIVD